MKYIIDRIENEYVILENFDTHEIINVPFNKINLNNLSDGDVVKYENNIYSFDKLSKEERLKQIKEKLNKVKHISDN